MISHQSSGTNWPASLTTWPTGVCIQELAASIQKDDKSVPTATARVAVKWSPLPTRLMPNSMMPRKPASRKKAVSTS